ncbi:hypothetical protein [Nitrosomonas supralitoralis]|uniref:Guanylate kinase n=1 Tax=Nitrosomonas supralitoralis TaxID=2116706 RepID=A0A2P7NUG0_9PROT|nr:hypothetical protein [Nitrosomonas supralitoralis]PSJ17106.1 hypothetical protein C7H79_09825 [Nitrosomonas supralitoralis]
MSLIIVIFGASGSGKSTLMELLMRSGVQYSLHFKGTDRPPRQFDGIEIRCVDRIECSEYDYIYQSYGFHYGIQRSQIDSAIRENRHHFIICNNVVVIRALKHDYPNRVRVIFLDFDASSETLHAIQTARKIPDNEIKLRLLKTEALYKTFLQERELFDDVLFNCYGDKPEKLQFKIEQIIGHLDVPTTSRSPYALKRLDQLAKEIDTRLSTYIELTQKV